MTTHRCPRPDIDGGLMPCCKRTPFEVPMSDRISAIEALVTCAPTSVGLGGLPSDLALAGVSV